MSYHIPLDDNNVKTQLTDMLGKENYKQVIETDILDRSRKLDIDKPQKFNEKIANVVFLYSLIGAVKMSGATYTEIKLSVCIPGDDDAVIDQTLKDLERRLWYINTNINGQLYFDTEPNIHKIIDDYKLEVTHPDQYENEILKVLNELTNNSEVQKKNWRFIIWDINSIGDGYEGNCVFIVDYKDAGDSEHQPSVIKRQRKKC